MTDEARIARLTDLAAEWYTKAQQWMCDYRAAGNDEHSPQMEAARQQLILAYQRLERAKGEPCE